MVVTKLMKTETDCSKSSARVYLFMLLTIKHLMRMEPHCFEQVISFKKL